MNYERTRFFEAPRSLFFNHDPVRTRRRSRTPSSSHPRNGPVIDSAIENASFPVVDTLEDVLSAIQKMQKPGI